MSRRIGWMIGALALLLGLGLFAWQTSGADDGEWQEITRRTLVESVAIEGELEAVESVSIGPPSVPDTWNFNVVFLAEDGAEVRAGQPVVGFDAEELKRQLEQKEAERDTAEKELEKKQLEVEERTRDDRKRLAEAEARRRTAEFTLEVPEDVTARRELQKTRIDARLAGEEIEYLRDRLDAGLARGKLEMNVLRARRDQAAAKVEALQRAVGSMRVQAPRDGTFMLTEGRDGEKVGVGDSVWRARVVATIPDLTKLRAVGTVDEADMGRLADGQSVTFRLDAFPDVEYRAVVDRVATTVTRRSDADPSKVANVVLDLQSIDSERMRPGMRLRGRIETARSETVLAVPADAVQIDTEGAWVEVRRSLGTERVRPELGERSDGYFEVLGGLEPGDRVRLAEGSSREVATR